MFPIYIIYIIKRSNLQLYIQLFILYVYFQNLYKYIINFQS